MMKMTVDTSRRVAGVRIARNDDTRVLRTPRRPKIGQGSEISRDEYDAHMARTMSEDSWRQHIRELAHDAGFHRKYHTYRSDRSDPGWPDDVLSHHELPRLLFIEAKRQSGVLSFDQVGWLDDLARMRQSGARAIEVYGAVRPLDRPRLIQTLYRGEPAAIQTLKALHQWCLRDDCEVCPKERQRAKAPTRGRGRRDKKRGR